MRSKNNKLTGRNQSLQIKLKHLRLLSLRELIRVSNSRKRWRRESTRFVSR